MFSSYIMKFFIFSASGWILETLYSRLTYGRFISKQTLLTLPLCPIYGTGAVLFDVFLTPVADSVILLFCGGFLLASSLELTVFLLSEKFFDIKWWDYSENFANLMGGVSAFYSLAWGLLSVIAVKFLIPYCNILISLLPARSLRICVYTLCILFAGDLANTLKCLIAHKKGIAPLPDVFSFVRTD